MSYEIMPASGKVCDGRFVYPARVYYEDTDAGGIVYYANYLKFAERARTEFLRFLGQNQEPELANDKTGFVVRSCRIEYLASARLDDSLAVTCALKELGGASAVVEQEIYCGEKLLTTLEVKLIYMSMAKGRPIRLPAEMTEKLREFLPRSVS